jgi:CTD small phosphatase-like protein 2
VLDLDETLIHYEDQGTQGRFLIRPYAYQFLSEMSKYYEIIIFTAAMQDVPLYKIFFLIFKSMQTG